MAQVLPLPISDGGAAMNNREYLLRLRGHVYRLILEFQRDEVYPSSVQQSIHRDRNQILLRVQRMQIALEFLTSYVQL